MKKVFFFVILLAGLVSAQLIGPKISAKEDTHDFGEVKEGVKVTHRYEIFNTGDEILKINKVKASCGCTAAKPEKNELKPGEFTTVGVTFNTARRRGMQKKFVYIFSNDKESPEYRLAFTANILSERTQEIEKGPRMVLIKDQHNFGKVKQGEIVTTKLAFANTGLTPLKINNVKASCGCTTTDLPRDLLQPGEKSYIDVKFDTKGRKGRMSRTITFYTNDPLKPVQSVRLYINILEG